METHRSSLQKSNNEKIRPLTLSSIRHGRPRPSDTFTKRLTCHHKLKTRNIQQTPPDPHRRDKTSTTLEIGRLSNTKQKAPKQSQNDDALSLSQKRDPLSLLNSQLITGFKCYNHLIQIKCLCALWRPFSFSWNYYFLIKNDKTYQLYKNVCEINIRTQKGKSLIQNIRRESRCFYFLF
jgi:hypothetical protein